MRSLTYYIGTTLDGRIAGPADETAFFDPDEEVLGLIAREFPDTLPTHVRASAGLGSQADRFDTVVMGRRTYEPALDLGVTDPYAHLRTYVVSRTLGASAEPNVEVIASDPLDAVRNLKCQEGGDMWLAGGGELAGELLPEIDELALKIYPCVAGVGRPLFAASTFDGRQWTSTDTKTLSGGMILARYRR